MHAADPSLDEQNGHLSDVLENYAASVTANQVTLGDLLDLLQARSIGALLLIFALPVALPVPMPGISLALGIPLVIIAAQLVIGSEHVWLPVWLQKRAMKREQFVKVVNGIVPILRKLEMIVRPRWTFLIHGWSKTLIGLLCIFLALIVALPVPFGNVVPSLAISFFGIALIQRDGLVVGLGAGMTVLAFLIIGGIIF